MPTPQERIRVAEVVAALSLATDLGMGQPMQFAMRTCLLAVRLAQAIGVSDADLRTTYYTALLRSAGCTAESPLEANVFGDEIAARIWLSALDFGRPAEVLGALAIRIGAREPPLHRVRMLGNALATLPRLSNIETAHCEVARQMAGYLSLSADVQRAVAEVFERWDGRGLPRHLKGESISLPARVVALAFDAVLFEGLGGVEGAVAIVRQRAGGKYEPSVARTFRDQATRLLNDLGESSAWDSTLAAEPEPHAWLGADQFDAAVRSLGAFADLLSPSLAGHSSGVAALAEAAAGVLGMPASDQTAVRLAGLTQDVGRAAIPAAIWNKPGPLNEAERERVRLHAYYTERILARAPALSEMARLAALHHERLDGSGYHRGASAAALPMTARVLAAADTYQALREPRPYRAACAPEAAAKELRRCVTKGWVDGEAANAVLQVAGGATRARRRAWPAGLSDREIEVVRLVARGLSNRQIGQALTVSPRTAGNHIQHIYDKLGMSTRAAVTLFATQHDLLGESGHSRQMS